MSFQREASKVIQPPHTPEFVRQRDEAAQEIYARFDFGAALMCEEDRIAHFGPDVEILDKDLEQRFLTESRSWQHTATGDVWMRPVFLYVNQGDVPAWTRVQLYVVFISNSNEAFDAFTLDEHGSLYGRLPDEDEASRSYDESLLMGPWEWREVVGDNQKTLALALETRARPLRDPIILQVLLDHRSWQTRQHAAARDMMSLAPTMLDLLARIVKSSNGPSALLASYIGEAEDLLQGLARTHNTVDFRVPGFWSAEE